MSEIKKLYTIQFCDKQDDAVSKPIDANDIPERVKSVEDGNYVLWLHHGVFVGKINNFRFDISDLKDYLIRIRIFNQDKEWHIWRTGQGFEGRSREDKQLYSEDDKVNNNRTPFVETSMRLRGDIVKKLGSTGKNENRYIKTRNYIDFNEIGQAGYIDSRFVEFIKK